MGSVVPQQSDQTSPITITSQRALTQRVVSSAAFAKSERLSSFLRYVCDLTASGRAGEINEQNIGSAVFGRAPDYDSSIDTIVRTQASRLRQRLELYFAEEGAAEPVCIEIPRGGYVPFFRRRPKVTEQSTTLTSATEQKPATLAGTAKTPWWKRTRFAWFCAACLAIGLASLILSSRREKTYNESARSALHPFWSLLVQPHKQLMVVPGDSGLVMWEGLTRNRMDLATYVTGAYRSRGSAISSSDKIDATNLANRRYTSIVDLQVVLAISRIAQKQGGEIQVRFSRDLRPEDAEQGNVVLIGAPEANPWVELFQPGANFYLQNDLAQHVFSVVNRTPGGSEPKSWNSPYNNSHPQPLVYGLVSFLPSLRGTGNVLLLQGTSMAGTECAVDFVSDDSALLPFLDRIKQSNGALPHFELVLAANNLNGSSAKCQILASRVHN